MTDNYIAIQHCLKAKADWKRDFTVLLVFAIVFSIVSFCAFYFIVPSFSNVMGKILFSLTFGIVSGAYVACLIFGMVIAFKFAWQRISFASLFLIFIVYAVAAAAGPVFTIVKLVTGHVKIKKLWKLLEMY